MQARFYAPWYGRFLSPDPARDQHFEETQSWNIYSYVRNNPITQIDPDGQYVKVVQNGNNVKLIYPVTYGQNATAARRGTFQAGMNMWAGRKGKYNVTVQLVEGKVDGHTNVVNFVEKPLPGDARGNTAGNANTDAVINLQTVGMDSKLVGSKVDDSGKKAPDYTDTKGLQETSAHEGGHSMMKGTSEDHAFVIDSKGEATTKPGRSRDDIMNLSTDKPRKVTEKDVDAVIKAKKDGQ